MNSTGWTCDNCKELVYGSAAAQVHRCGAPPSDPIAQLHERWLDQAEEGNDGDNND